MGIKVLFIYPDFLAVERATRPEKYDFETGGWYAEGLAALAASLKEAGHAPVLLHVTSPLPKEDFCTAVKKVEADLIGFTVRSSAFVYCSQYAAWAKEVSPAPVIWGGYHPTLAPEECLAVPEVDAVCLGEGDEAFRELADKIAAGNAEEEQWRTESFWFRTPSGVVKNSVRPLVENLDLLPLPYFELFEPAKLIAYRTRTATAILSRGCPYRCGYCSNHRQRAVYPNSTRYPRSRSPEGAVAYLQALSRWDPGAKEIRFLDNIFGLSRKWLEGFVPRYQQEIGLPFSCNHRPELLTPPVLALLAKAGCQRIYLGVESGDEEIRRLVLGRTASNARLLEVFRACRELGIETVAYNMVGLPGEDRRRALATIKLNARLRPSSAIISVFSPYPGTDLYDLAVGKGYVAPHLDYRARTFLNQPDFSRAEVAFLALYFRPLMLFYRFFGSSLGRFLDKLVLAKSLPLNFFVRLGELNAHYLQSLKSGVQKRSPGFYRFLRRLKKAARL